MAHFAKISDENLVLNVEVVADADTTNDSNIEDEATGVAFLTAIHGWSSWAKCSYNTKQGKYYDANNEEASDQSKAYRKNYPLIGYTWDSTRNMFYPPKPYASWTLNETKGDWECPVDFPTIQVYGDPIKTYDIVWDESNSRWSATDQEDPVGSFYWDATNLNWVAL